MNVTWYYISGPVDQRVLSVALYHIVFNFSYWITLCSTKINNGLCVQSTLRLWCRSDSHTKNKLYL
jgi:hypothetical protein